MRKVSTTAILIVSATIMMAASAQDPPQATKPTVDADGTVHVPAMKVPLSALSSEEAKRNFLDFARGFESLKKAGAAMGENPSMVDMRRMLDDLLMKPGVEGLRAVFPVKITPEKIGGVQTDIIEPMAGVSKKNAGRVLINLHGGGMIVGARFGGQMESIPIASLGAMKVITVDYRMAPEHQFPAASEDVAKVYRELLKSYRPQNIGIYGCSAGAVLTAQSVAWFKKHQLPRPGAVGMFGSGAAANAMGDSNYVSAAIGGMGFPVAPGDLASPPPPRYIPTSVDLRDPLVSPIYSPAILAEFPPSLLISGTRDMALSATVFTHAQLIKAGVKADLHVWEGAPHCSFAQPVVNPDEPESREAWDVIVKFFDSRLGKK